MFITTCPWCDTAHDSHDGREEIDMPSPGDVSLCAGCLGPSIFILTSEGVTLRRANLFEQQRILRDPVLRPMVDALVSHLGRPTEEAVAHWRSHGQAQETEAHADAEHPVQHELGREAEDRGPREDDPGRHEERQG